MKKLIICNCGRIHLITEETLKNVSEGKVPVLVCKGYSGKCLNQYVIETNLSKDFVSESDKWFIEDEGYSVPMMDGCFANNFDPKCKSWEDLEKVSFSHVHVVDSDTVSRYMVEHNIKVGKRNFRKTEKEILKKGCIVDMKKLVEITPKEVIEELKKYDFGCMNWSDVENGKEVI